MGFEAKPVLTDLAEVKKYLPLVFDHHAVKGSKDFPKADLYLDVRGVANPSASGGPGGNGDNPVVQAWVSKNSDIAPYTELIEQALSRMTSRRGAGKEYEKPFKIVTMCAHGVHRSRAMKHILAYWAKKQGYKVVEVK